MAIVIKNKRTALWDEMGSGIMYKLNMAYWSQIQNKIINYVLLPFGVGALFLL